jgi:hypothetical protein
MNRSFNMAPVQARYVWYPSRSFGYGVGVQANDVNRLFLDEPCGVRVEPKALPPENVAAGGVAGICVHLHRRSKRGSPCTECIHASADITKRCTHGWSMTVWESDRAKSGITVVAQDMEPSHRSGVFSTRRLGILHIDRVKEERHQIYYISEERV